MKRLLLLVALTCLTWSASALDVRLGVSGSGSLLFNNQWSTELSSLALGVNFVGLGELFPEGPRWEAGVEMAGSGLGAQLLVPLGLSVSTDPKAEWSTEVALHALVGGTFHKPMPSPLVGAETELRGFWTAESGWGLGLSAGLRYTMAPAYSDSVAPYAVLEVPVRVDVKF